MDPSKWGPYGWKMIHTYSRLNISLREYTKWLKATSKILPCRKCRENFKRHIHSQICKPAKSSEYLSVCLHNAVSTTIKKASDKSTKYKIDELPGVNRENIFQPEFWSTIYLNTTLGKNKVLREWVRETEYILRRSGMIKEADGLMNLIDGKYGDFLPEKKQDLTRKRHIRKVIHNFFKDMGVRTLNRSQELSRLGKSFKPRATRKRVRILSRKDPSGKTRKVSRNCR